MATPTYGVPLEKEEGETLTLSTSAQYLSIKPGWREVKMYCATQWRIAHCPALLQVLYFDTSGSSYTNYTTYATDKLTTTHVPLDAMATGDALYLGVAEKALGFYFTIDDTNFNDNAATLDMEYCYDSSDGNYVKVTGTVSGAFTVGETVTSGTYSNTGTLVYGPAGSTYIVLKDVSGNFQVGETLTGGSSNETCSAVTAVITEALGTPYFTDVASDSDGTKNNGDTLAQSGAYTFTLPSIVRSQLTGLTAIAGKCYWYRFFPSATLDTTVDIQQILPIYQNTTYGYREPGIEYEWAIPKNVGGFVLLASSGTPTLDITWLHHSG